MMERTYYHGSLRFPRGLTLVELLVAMTLSAVVITIAFSIYLYVQVFYRREQIKDELEAEIERVEEPLKKDLRRAKTFLSLQDDSLAFIDESDETTSIYIRTDTLFRNSALLSEYCFNELTFSGNEDTAGSNDYPSWSADPKMLKAKMVLVKQKVTVSSNFCFSVRK